MIIVDLEMSGLDPIKNGIWQIGALDLENPENIFFQESRIDDDEEIDPIALKVIGKTEQELRDKNKQSEKQLLEKFFEWTKTTKINNIAGQSIQCDWMFLIVKSNKYGLKIPYHHRILELGSIANLRYYQLHNEILIDKGKLGLNLTEVLKMCGMQDERRYVKDGVIIKEGPPHDALSDAKLTAECFSRILYTKKLLPEFEKFQIPENLKK